MTWSASRLAGLVAIGTVLVVGSSARLPAAQSDPQAIQRMVATERAFAAATERLGARDGFLTFFASDAVTIVPGHDGASATVGPARPGIAARSVPALPLATSLMWAPFTGQISSDGSMGWLTGAYMNVTMPDHQVTAHGAYFSVWKRQADGTWRVWLDEGIALPAVWDNAGEFRVAPDPDAGTAGAPNEPLAVAETAIASGSDAWAARLGRDVRVHRDNMMPIVGREEAFAWGRAAWARVTFSVARVEPANSDDLGVTLGGYETSDGHGTWVRAWKRDAAGRWRIVFETSKAA